MAVQSRFLIQFLEECHQVERSGKELYDGAISRCTDEVVKAKLIEFRDQTAHHVDIVEDLIGHFGGKVSSFKEQMGAVLGKLTSGLSSVQGTGDYQQWKDLDNLLTAEYKDHSCWKVLKTVAEVLNDARLTQAVDEVEAQEDMHVDWLERQVNLRAPQAIVAAGSGS